MLRFSLTLQKAMAEHSFWGYGEGEKWAPDDDPSSILSAEELAQVEEAYQAADTKLRSLWMLGRRYELGI